MKSFKTPLKYCILVYNVCSLASKSEIDATGCGYWGLGSHSL